MKKEIATLFLTLTAAFGFAQANPSEQPLPQIVQLEVNQTRPSLDAKATLNRSFSYLRMGASDSRLPKDTDQILPSVGLGYRLIAGASAVDFSTSLTARDIHTALGNERTYLYTLPKVNYYYYLSSNRNHSLYAGGGAAVGGVRTSKANEFHGIVGNGTIGFEMNRNAALRSFLQFDVSQALLAASQKGDLPRPYAEFSFGVGF